MRLDGPTVVLQFARLVWTFEASEVVELLAGALDGFEEDNPVDDLAQRRRRKRSLVAHVVPPVRGKQFLQVQPKFAFGRAGGRGQLGQVGDNFVQVPIVALLAVERADEHAEHGQSVLVLGGLGERAELAAVPVDKVDLARESVSRSARWGRARRR